MKKTIGIIGGLSPESTVTYYLNITRKYYEQYKNYSYPEIVIFSVNFEKYIKWRDKKRWYYITQDLIQVGLRLRSAEVDFCIIATNTLHKVFYEVQSKINLPFIHILTPTIEAIKKLEIKKIGLLGTKFVMKDNFYKNELINNQITTIVPNLEQQTIISQTIQNELACGIINKESKEKFMEIINDLIVQGAEGIILGCTEIPLLIKQIDFNIPIFDTAVLHSDAALKFALQE